MSERYVFILFSRVCLLCVKCMYQSFLCDTGPANYNSSSDVYAKKKNFYFGLYSSHQHLVLVTETF